jgi:nucleoside triphosphate diphosphatase
MDLSELERSLVGSGSRLPVSIKGVLFEADRVVLLENERSEWELPGGRLEPGEDPTSCLVREVAEELGAVVAVEAILDSWLYCPLPKREVLIVSYGLRRTDAGPLRASTEHRRIGSFTLEELDGLPMPEGYRRSIRCWAARRVSADRPLPRHEIQGTRVTAALDELLAIMARLRDRERGCPWDLEQDFASIAPYTIEEAYEVAEAIARGDMTALEDELGDLLFQVVFHARMAEEGGFFAFAEVARAIADKMVRRHPHVFGDTTVADAAAQSEAWEAHKAGERAARAAAAGTPDSVLDGVALAYPALLRASKIQKRAARIGFDWPAPRPVVAKVAEELGELEAELDGGADPVRIDDEIGDLLFAVANLARKLDIDPEAALRRATAKFERRFRQVEALAAERGAGHDLDTLEALWQEVKRGE